MIIITPLEEYVNSKGLAVYDYSRLPVHANGLLVPHNPIAPAPICSDNGNADPISRHQPGPLRRHGGVFPRSEQQANRGLRAIAPRHRHRPLRHPRHRGRDPQGEPQPPAIWESQSVCAGQAPAPFPGSRAGSSWSLMGCLVSSACIQRTTLDQA